MANNELFTAAGGERPNFPNVLLVLTDGQTSKRSKKYEVVLKPLKVHYIYEQRIRLPISA